MILKFNKIRNLIPHRYPFLLVDKIVDFSENDSAIGIKNIVYGDPYLEYDIDENQYYPIELMIESLGQLTAMLYAISNPNGKREFILGSIKGIEICHRVPANSQIKLEVKISHMTENYAIASGSAFCNGIAVLKVEEFICKINPI